MRPGTRRDTRARLALWAWLGAVLAALAVAPATAGGVGSAPAATETAAACKPGISGLAARDVRYVREFRRLLAAAAPATWPGWRRVPPLLQRSGRCEYLFGHPAAPKAFRRVGEVAGWPVHAAPAGTATTGAAASARRVGTAWTAVVPVRADLQRELDRTLGAGKERLDDTLYLRALLHEAFRVHQLTVTKGAPPAFGSKLGELGAADLLRRLGNAQGRLAQEGRALARGLDAGTLAEARRAAASFLHLRQQRRAATVAPGALAAFERRLEWAEGTARYADLKLALRAGGAEGATPGVRWQTAAASRRGFLAQLGDAAARPDGLTGRLRDLGAAQSLLLDRLLSGWRSSVLPGRASLEQLLASAAEPPLSLVERPTARISLGGKQLTVAVADNPTARALGLCCVANLGSLDGMLFDMGGVRPETNGFWMLRVQFPLDIAWIGPDGRVLSVDRMPVCPAEPCPSHYPPAPYRWTVETAAGGLAGVRPGARLVFGR